jgi:thiol-disulfide isomerase/thioredoxin
MHISDIKSDKGTVVMFLCNHCPYVKHINNGLVRLVKEYQEKGIAFVGISSNDVVRYPDDSPEKMTETALAEGYTFPYLFDETQEVARSYDAACTPDFYLFDGSLRLIYRGQMDASRPGNNMPVTGNDLREALNALLESRPQAELQRPSAGCNIKWKV